VSARTEAAFTALMGLDPLRGMPGAEQAASRAPQADPARTDTEARIARIIATPRPGTMTEPAPRPPHWTATAHRRRARYGAIGLVASAAIAAITTLLWASPSAGAPPDQALTVPAQVAHVHPPQAT
jgi:ferric-dicitrate binding protein FerR (iron transport regulator)